MMRQFNYLQRRKISIFALFLITTVFLFSIPGFVDESLARCPDDLTVDFTWTPQTPKQYEPITFTLDASCSGNGCVVTRYQFGYTDGESFYGWDSEKEVAGANTYTGTYTYTFNRVPPSYNGYTPDFFIGFRVWCSDNSFNDYTDWWYQRKEKHKKVTIQPADTTTGGGVNSTADKDDSDLTDGVCNTGFKVLRDSVEEPECTLRAAMQEANKKSGKDRIAFAIPISDPGYSESIFTIRPQKPLPAINEAVAIDASTQSSGKIVLNGGSAGADANGLDITTSDVTVKGLIIQGFKGNGVTFENEGVINLSDMEVVENCGWGILANGSIDLGASSSARINKISNNGKDAGCSGGGIWSYNGHVAANLIRVEGNGGPGILSWEDVTLDAGAQVNNNKGPGIQSFVGSVSIDPSADADLPLQVIGNKGYGIWAGAGYSRESDPPSGPAIRIGSHIEVRDNGKWGMYAKGKVLINDIGGGISGSKGISVISNNGNGSECWVIETRDGTLTQVDCQAAGKSVKFGGGGIMSYEGYVDANHIKVIGNGGPGILSWEDVTLDAGAQVNNNKGPGIQSFVGSVSIDPSADADLPLQVIGNKGYGIWAGAGYSRESDPPSGPAIRIGSHIEVRDNGKWGMYAKGKVLINDIGGGISGSKGISVISNNGNGSECRVIETRDGTLTQVDCQAAEGSGGVWSDSGYIIANNIKVADNGGPGIKAFDAVTIYIGQFCNNTGGDIIANGPKDLQDVIQQCGPDITITISSNEISYSPGDTLTLSVSINNLSSEPQLVDAYLGLIFPDGSLYFFDSSMANLKPAKSDDPRTFTPVRSSLSLSPGYQLPFTNFFSLVLPQDFPAGTYTAFAVFAEAGSVQAGTPKLIGDISRAPFTFSR